PSRLTKAKRNNRINELSEGLPGDLPLAPPLQSNANSPVINNHVPETPSIDIQRPLIIDAFLEPLNTILDVDDLEEAFGQFQNLMESLTKVMQDHFHLSFPPGNVKKGPVKPFDSQNAQKVQRLNRLNRRRCIRNIVNSNSSRCPASKESILSYFKNCWSAPNLNFSLPSSSSPDLPPILDILSPEAVSSCLHGCENSAPGPDLLTYQHWREADPKKIILSRVFNICLKLKDIPQVWKLSNCILLPKKGDPSALENWRPISLSNTVYKLFSKCLTRKLQDWCEMNNIISRCQKGFTPYDGVDEHNFIIGQHLENARRSHTNAFLVWLDISNAFGSISHEVLFSTLKNA
ncbi:retrovirus-related Pol polyprotein from type-1 retrotransposable element R2, partial [Nephila pilipes]